MMKKNDQEWRNQLTPEQYYVCRGRGTEASYSGLYYNNTEKGEYVCVCCQQRLFDSASQFNSGCGWPSFTRPVDSEALREVEDTSHGMVRIEVQCRQCDAHLGHVFPDGPPPTGLRYCINSVAMIFIKKL